MDATLFPRGVGLGFAIAATVGPISLLVVRRTIAEGRVTGLVSGLGVATADASYGAIAAFGVTAATAVLIDARRPLALVGGLVLLGLAWRTIRSIPTEPSPERPEERSRGDLAAAWATFYGLTLTNPLTILSFAALFVGLGVSGGDTAGALLLTGGVWVGSALWWAILTLVVARLRGRIGVRGLRWVNVISGFVVAAFGVVAIASVAMT